MARADLARSRSSTAPGTNAGAHSPNRRARCPSTRRRAVDEIANKLAIELASKQARQHRVVVASVFGLLHQSLLIHRNPVLTRLAVTTEGLSPYRHLRRSEGVCPLIATCGARGSVPRAPPSHLAYRDVVYLLVLVGFGHEEHLVGFLLELLGQILDRAPLHDAREAVMHAEGAAGPCPCARRRGRTGGSGSESCSS